MTSCLSARGEDRAATVSIAGKTYATRWIEGTYGASENYSVSRHDLAYIWDGKTAWSVDPQRARVLNTFAAKAPVLALSPDQSLALVYTRAHVWGDDKTKRLVNETQTVLCLVDVATQETIARFQGLRFSQRWVFSPDGKFIYPLAHSHHKKYLYIDVEKKAIEEITIWDDSESADGFFGVSDSESASIAIFARARDNNYQSDEGYSKFVNKIVRIETNYPLRISVAPDTSNIAQAFAMRNGKVLCLLRNFESIKEGKSATNEWRIGLIDAQSGEVETTSELWSDDRIQWANWTPNGKEIYAIDDFDGLTIYDATTLKPITSLRTGGIDGYNYSIGATFSADGKFAYIAESRGEFYVIDIASHKIIETNKQLGIGIAGVLPAGDECFIIATKPQWH